MPYESSFGTLDSRGKAEAAPQSETKFRIALLADFSGRATRSEGLSIGDLASRKPIKVNFDKFEEVLEKQAVKLRVPIAGGGKYAELEFPTLDDFHPDQIYKQVDLFEELADLRSRLERSSSFEVTAEKMRAWAQSPPVLTPPSASRGTLIPRCAALGDFAERLARPNPEDSGASTVELLARVLGPLVPMEGEPNEEAFVAAVDRATSGLMREILHHPDFQALEGAWRELEWLLRLTEKSTQFEVVMFDIAAEEFAADLAASDDLNSTGLYQLLVEKTAHAVDGDPWALIVGNYIFEPSGPHADLLARIGKFADLLTAPFLAAIDSRVLSGDYMMDPAGMPAWQALRKSPEAAYLGLAVPGFLLRIPYGEAYKPAEQFAFEEFSKAEGARGYLWGNPGLAAAALLAKSFVQTGWDMKLGTVLQLDGLPLHVYTDEDDAKVGVSTEVRFTAVMSRGLADQGCMPVLAVRGRDAIELACVQSMAFPAAPLAGRWAHAKGVVQAASTRLPPVKSGMGLASESTESYGPKSSASASSTSQTTTSEVSDDDLWQPGKDDSNLPGGEEESSDDGSSSDEETPPEDTPAEDTPAEDAPAEDPPAEDPPADETPAEDTSASDVDAELAALMGDTASTDEPAAEAPADTDAELAALFGETPASDAPDSDAPAEEPASDIDAELAAIMGDTATSEPPADEPPAEDPPVEEDTTASDTDAELAALFGESPPAAEPEEPAADTPESSETAEPSETAMATDTATTPGVDELIRLADEKTKWFTKGTPPAVEFKSLLEPIPGENPAGGSVPFVAREKLEELRKEINPEDYAEDDPLRPTDIKLADWNGIIRLGQEVLTETSKDLLVTARVVEALTKQRGFAGLRDGLHLIRLMVEVCWDRLSPEIEDDDWEVRAAAFTWLDDPDRGRRFPVSVRSLPLIVGAKESFSWTQWKQAQDGKGKVTADDVERAAASSPRERCDLMVSDILQAAEELKQLDTYLGEKLANVAPGFTSLRPAILEALLLAQQVLHKKGPGEGAAPAGAAGGQAAGGGGTADGPSIAGTGVSQARTVTRDDLYNQLDQVASRLQAMEPHSPIPYLIKRAVELGKLPFPDLLRTLVRDNDIVKELSRELGLGSPKKKEEEEEE